jgi:hypothetical protein
MGELAHWGKVMQAGLNALGVVEEVWAVVVVVVVVVRVVLVVVEVGAVVVVVVVAVVVVAVAVVPSRRNISDFRCA